MNVISYDFTELLTNNEPKSNLEFGGSEDCLDKEVRPIHFAVPSFQPLFWLCYFPDLLEFCFSCADLSHCCVLIVLRVSAHLGINRSWADYLVNELQLPNLMYWCMSKENSIFVYLIWYIYITIIPVDMHMHVKFSFHIQNTISVPLVTSLNTSKESVDTNNEQTSNLEHVEFGASDDHLEKDVRPIHFAVQSFLTLFWLCYFPDMLEFCFRCADFSHCCVLIVRRVSAHLRINRSWVDYLVNELQLPNLMYWCMSKENSIFVYLIWYIYNYYTCRYAYACQIYFPYSEHHLCPASDVIEHIQGVRRQ